MKPEPREMGIPNDQEMTRRSANQDKQNARHFIAAHLVAVLDAGRGYGAVSRTRMVPYHSGGMLVARVPVPPQPRFDTMFSPLIRLVLYSNW